MPLSFSTMTLPCADVGPDSCTPAIFPTRNVQTEKTMYITEEDEVFFDIGRIPTILPYGMQILNTRRLAPRTVRTAVLENEYLRAVFLPEYGARLWSLYDKKGQRELLYVNDCILPGNLALCGAWFSGGVEWNIGMIGHSPFTCRPLSMARLETPDGGEWLRFFGFERVREAVFQMDFSLPADSRALLCRMRIKNTQNRTIPMYWFSNIAVPEDPDGRVLVPADEAYYSGIGYVKKTAVPLREDGSDLSYPTRTVPSTDYFYKIPDRRRRFIAYADGRGRGMFQTSTARQKGRKLFVWGQGSGADRWQEWLTDKAGRYIEIQAGVGPTQYECIPMPPNAAWEWVEAYGPLDADPAALHGGYREAVAHAAAAIEETVGEDRLEQFLVSSKAYALTSAEMVETAEGDGWAALERRCRESEGRPSFEPHLDFGSITAEQRDWLTLLETGRLPDAAPGKPPASHMASPAWRKRLEEAAQPGWLAHYHRGILHTAAGDMDPAAAAFEASLKSVDNAWAHYGLAAVALRRNDGSAVVHMRAAMRGNLHRTEMVREYFLVLLRFGEAGALLECAGELPVEVREDGGVRLLEIRAHMACGNLEKAETLLMADGGLEIPAFREGTNDLSDAWLELQELKAAARGENLDRETLKVPQVFDFRME